MKTWMFVIVATVCVMNGCSSQPSQTEHSWQTFEDCHAENTDLQTRIDALMDENTALTEQVQTLSKLDSQVRLNTLATLQSIHIGKRSGLYDKDNDGQNEKLIVYLEPKDTVQDYIKAVGQCSIELWSLEAKPEAALLKRWTVGPSDLHPTWGGNIFGAYYRLVFDIEGVIPNNETELTVKAKFTDYLSGKTLRDQKTIQP